MKNTSAELESILLEVGPRNIWRPVYDNRQKLLAQGIADWRDGHPDDIARVDFTGKTVLDLGCNFGFYSFLASKLGAAWVLGVDDNELVVRGGRILREMHRHEGVDFVAADFTKVALPGPFDIAMLINFIGKKKVRKGVQTVLDSLEKLARETMIVSARHTYGLEEHLKISEDLLLEVYPAEYLAGGEFLLLDYIRDYYSPRWDMSIISPDYNDPEVKRTLLFTRRNPAA